MMETQEYEETVALPVLHEELCAIGQQIEAYRQARRPVPSDRAWARQWSGLGSAKTWAKIRDGDLSQLSVEANLPLYRSVLSALGAMTAERESDQLYSDLAGAQALHLAALRLMMHQGKDRLILVEGGSGSGKTSSLDLLSSSGVGSTIYRLDADETWKSQRVAMRCLLTVSGYPEAKIPDGSGAMMERLKDWLTNKGRVTFAIDEGHHVSGPVLNLFKSLLNSTDIMLIIAGMATLLQKLRASASEESKQLIHNRLFTRIRLAGPDEDGVRTYLSRRLKSEGRWKPGTMKAISQAAAHAGYWSFLRRTCDQLRTGGMTDPDDADLLAAANQAQREIE